MKNVKFRG